MTSSDCSMPFLKRGAASEITAMFGQRSDWTSEETCLRGMSMMRAQLNLL